MEKVSTILSHLSNIPQFRSLKQQYCYRKFINLLSAKYQKAIAFVYIKDETLFVAVTHPGFKMELNYNRDLLKSILTQLQKYDTKCSHIEVEKVVVFHSKYHPIKTKSTVSDSAVYYTEHATAHFSIEAKDKEIKEKFENIKRILSNRE